MLLREAHFRILLRSFISFLDWYIEGGRTEFMGNKIFFVNFQISFVSQTFILWLFAVSDIVFDKGLGGNTDSINVVLYLCFIVFIF